ncbi:tRNA (adenosine(37)-N6)-threonylcarbamoyltransferase complex dimerization subunit type 1 TsaB [Actinobacillus arthritidis]|uniref:tRNA (adenosine(37)-N6)-threonylcarbamoyltransferase complex dimerization subunit type 1 TsaB n=1 Tax=Actinobacillus arthritidis TaxID=157339 RepID=UPI0024413261|nr:tRNA (adenosine(37)-N6)-threonylcarbamoyltransferase complex dimerization subunit type 1 TsaB [Actinobacillus arthritidis]WGE89942.1 tRNA (adenosine(37)-N6)-threonylcarbamoyltransferase complex dimerization subunit type 1 TsaB [Actinobacillus arthritidis]
MNKTILAIDTATEACSVALLHNGEMTSLDELSPRTHTQRILPMIDELLTKADISLKQVDKLAFGRGPGSFTGVRVGIGVAQGLAMGAELPVVPISNLVAMAQATYREIGADKVVALIDARMNEVYFAQYEKAETGWKMVVTEQVCSPEKAIAQIQLAEGLVVVGTGWQAYPQFAEADLAIFVTDIHLPSAKYMLELAQETTQTFSALEIEPVYLRNEVTWEKLPHKR